jgi:hypothetical protein
MGHALVSQPLPKKIPSRRPSPMGPHLLCLGDLGPTLEDAVGSLKLGFGQHASNL